jgi:hypothetical protein
MLGANAGCDGDVPGRQGDDGRMTAATIRIVGHHLPGRSVDQHANVHVGIQRGRDVIETVPADAPGVEFVVSIDVVDGAEGHPDFRGPFAQGKRGARFVYLNWGDVGADGVFTGFGRVKLLLSELPVEVEEALLRGGAVRAEVDLTHPRGGPVYASVPRTNLRWTVDDEGTST